MISVQCILSPQYTVHSYPLQIVTAPCVGATFRAVAPATPEDAHRSQNAVLQEVSRNRSVRAFACGLRWDLESQFYRSWPAQISVRHASYGCDGGYGYGSGSRRQ